MKFGNSKNYKDLKVKPGEVLFIPSDNRHLEMPPTVNTSSNPPGWFRKMGKFPGSVRRCAGTIDPEPLFLNLKLDQAGRLTPAAR